MKPFIVISCILASGQHVEPRGHYSRWEHCGKFVEYFENKLYPPIGNKWPLCWCHRVDRELNTVPAPTQREIDDRKAPL